VTSSIGLLSPNTWLNFHSRPSAGADILKSKEWPEMTLVHTPIRTKKQRMPR
jgi:hypothetical protein